MKTYQGDTTDILYIRPGPLNNGDPIDVNWTCSTGVIDDVGAILLASRAVTDIVTVPIKGANGQTTDEECFLCALTPAETVTLELGIHTWIVQVVNTTTTPPFNIEKHNILEIEKQGLA